MPALVLLAAGAVAYIPAYGAGFLWDDDTALTQNAVIHAPEGLGRIWGSFAMPDYFPLMWSVLWLEWRWFGMDPVGYHVVNVGLHLGGALLVWQVLERLRVPGAWLTATVFAVHPVTVASVAWISEIKNTLSLVFYALALLLFFTDEDRRGQERGGESRAGPFYWLSLVAFAAGLLSKSSGLLLPAVLLCCAWWRRGRIGRWDVARSIPFWLLALASAAASLVTQHQVVGNVVVRPEGLASRLAAAGMAFWFYVWKVMVPLNLSMVYPRWEVVPRSPWAWAPLAGLAAVVTLCWWRRGGWGRPPLFALAWMFAMLLPVAGFVDIYFMRYSLVADHWQYLSMLGTLALVVGCASTLVRQKASSAGRIWDVAGAVAAVALVGVLGALTWRQALAYATPESLWRDTIAKNPSAFVAHYNLGVRLEERGALEEARHRFEDAVRLAPAHVPSYVHLGGLSRLSGDSASAVQWYLRGLEVEGGNADLHYNLGVALSRQGQMQQAAQHFEAAVRARPEDLAGWSNLGSVLEQQGREGEALHAYEAALRLKPDLAVVQLRVAWLYAAASDSTLRKPDVARQMATLLCEGPGRGDAACLDLLAATYAAAGRFKPAVDTARQALDAATAAGQEALAAAIRKHLGCYETMQPWVTPARQRDRP